MANTATAEREIDLKASWQPIGTVVGNAGTSEFTFILQQFKARAGDIVALGMEIPDGGYSPKKHVYVWARITDISRFNPFFPFEAAQEIAGEGISLEDTVLSGTRDHLEAKALILGATDEIHISNLFPLTYPVKPASTVFYPPAEAVRRLLVGDATVEKNIVIGSLIARGDVEVTMSASKLVSRHMAILAMTGGGKTVAARRIIRQMIDLKYPTLILDPHGDYIGLWKCRNLFQDSHIKLFYPQFVMADDGEGIVEDLITQMTQGLSDPQRDYLNKLFSSVKLKAGKPVLEYIIDLIKKAESERGKPPEGQRAPTAPTIGAVKRALNMVRNHLQRMTTTNERMRSSSSFSGLDFQPLPNPTSQPDKIICPGQVSIVYLGGYDHITQCSIVSLLLDSLFNHRANLSGRIPPFQTIIEEAHTFIPSNREGTSNNAASIRTVRRLITEGRKFGTGLILISQRPSRLDETIVSQCNSFLILRLVNPKDQNFVRSIMENLTESDARMIPGFGPSQGIISGQVVRFPLPVMVKMDQELLASEIGDENFFEQVAAWKPDPKTSTREFFEKSLRKVADNNSKRRGRPPKHR